MSITEDVNQMLTAGGGAALKFDTPNTVHKGTVVAAEKRQQRDYATGDPKFWDNGDPMWEIVVTVDVGEEDENGNTERRLFVRGQMLKAVREAVREAGANGLAVGGTLTVKYTGDGEPTRKGFNAPKLFKARYEAPAPATVGVDDI